MISKWYLGDTQVIRGRRLARTEVAAVNFECAWASGGDMAMKTCRGKASVSGRVCARTAPSADVTGAAFFSTKPKSFFPFFLKLMDVLFHCNSKHHKYQVENSLARNPKSFTIAFPKVVV